jgi:hypothetical protein
VIACLIEALPTDIRQKVLAHVDEGMEGAKTVLLNDPNCSEAELEGFENVLGALKAARD